MEPVDRVPVPAWMEAAETRTVMAALTALTLPLCLILRAGLAEVAD